MHIKRILPKTSPKIVLKERSGNHIMWVSMLFIAAVLVILMIQFNDTVLAAHIAAPGTVSGDGGALLNGCSNRMEECSHQAHPSGVNSCMRPDSVVPLILFSSMDYNSSITPGFCADCGSILPLMRMSGGVTCYSCHKKYNEGAFGTMEAKYTIHFNTYEERKVDQQQAGQKSADSADGPIVSRKCPKCGNDKMSYAALQLRSVDEGQTVFFTCTKCQFKETENS